MLYKSYIPSPCLSAYITCFLQLETDITETEGGILCTFPTGFFIMNVFYSDDIPLFQFPNGETKVFQSFISGLLTKGVKIANNGSFKCVLIYFTPLGAYHLFKMHGSEYLNKFICPSEINKSWGQVLKKIKESSYDDTKIKTLEDFFTSILCRGDWKDKVFDDITHTINLYRGCIKIDRLLACYPLSPRTLDRNFLTITGLTPKRYINLVRLASSYKMLLHQSNLTVHDIIHLHGYYDQAHAIKEFLRYSDLSPTDLRNNPSKTAFIKLLIINT
jgi:AraC-type DNA-binding domain-containing proteins